MAASPSEGQARPAAELLDMVAAADTGGRRLSGPVERLVLVVAVTWSLFQLWYASPLPFVFGVLILNDTEARAVHLAFALFLAFAAFPASRRAAPGGVPWWDWTVAAVGAFAAAYIFIFYESLALRPGQPLWFDLVIAIVGLVILLEATRRSLGPPLVVIAGVFLAYSVLGSFMPEVIQHKGASFSRLMTHQWLTTEGVFGVALGVSTGFVFLFVLFGALLEQAGGGNYIMQVSFALLGHLRGGPAKVAVVSSALNGVISGSSISNVVSGGIFTIPMMKRSGLSGVKAGAIETASSVNGQIMPPVMGAAAFLMVEYVGIPYAQIVKHAFLPAVVSYIALFYIVHIEALKLNMQPLPRRVQRSVAMRLLRIGLGFSGTLALFGLIYYGILAVQAAFGAAAAPVLTASFLVAYVALLAYAARHPDLTVDGDDSPLERLPETWATVRTGLHLIFPLGVLIWALMVEQLSPGLSAFWATVAIVAIIVTQRPLIAIFRGERRLAQPLLQGVAELIAGLNLGARNMVAIGVATATAGIVVGTVTLTGMGLMMTDFVELISGGNVFLMLLLTGLICLFLGMGIPTTANYILVATLMAPVIVELGGQAGLAVPLIAVHLFVFYFGIMADVTPPVGLASYAAAAISGEDPIRTAWQGAVYSLRTVVLPFFFVFSPQILLIDIGGPVEFVLVVATATFGMMMFAAGSMGFFLCRSRLYESALLLLVCFTLLRPEFWLDRLFEPYADVPAERVFAVAESLPANGRLIVVTEGFDLIGDEVQKTVSLRLDDPGTGAARLVAAGLQLRAVGNDLEIAAVRFGSYAKRVRLEPGWRIVAVKVPAARPAKEWIYLPALALAGLVAAVQLRRRRRAGE